MAPRRARGAPLSLYIAALLIVPMTVVTMLAAMQIREDRNAARAVEEVASTLEVQSVGMNLLLPLKMEQITLAASARIDELDDGDVRWNALGRRFEAIADANQPALDVALASLGSVLAEYQSEASPDVVENVRLRRPIAASMHLASRDYATEVNVNNAFEELGDSVEAFIDEVSESLHATHVVDNVSGGLLVEVDMLSQIVATAEAEATLWYAAAAGSDVGDQELVAAHAEHGYAMRLTDQINGQGQLASLIAEHDHLGARRIEVSTPGSDEVFFDRGGNADLRALSALLARVEYLQSVQELAEQWADSVNARADTLARDARRQEATAISLLVLAIAAGGLVAAFVVKSFVGPLTRLRQRAEQITAGELSLEPLPNAGPRDVRAVTAAINEMAGTLSLIGSHMRDLAAGPGGPQDLDELPGEVGASMRESVQRVTDLTAQLHASEDQLADQARTDALTGLANRFAVLEYLHDFLTTADADESAVMFVDIDGFKSVNDTHGHNTGDIVLTEIAARLTATVRHGDFVARLGGDEFLIVVHGAPGTEVLRTFGQRLIREIEQPYVVGDQLFTVSASVGATILGASEAPINVIERADAAVYQAKRKGRGRVEMFDAVMQHDIEQRAEIELALRQAIRDGELVLNFQPFVDPQTGAVTGAEALVRWERPGVGMVRPADFIPIAERSALIFDLERWVFGDACRTLAEWTARGFDGVLAVNVSSRHLIDGDLLRDIDEAIDRTGADPRQLEIELTESQLLDDVDRANELLGAIRTRGIRIAIDDFGTGYSSMTYLQKLPVDAVKIDKSFVSRATANGFDATVVEAVITISESLDLDVVAEGVETAEQLAYVTRLGVARAQGFLIAAPMPADDAEIVVLGDPLGIPAGCTRARAQHALTAPTGG